MLENQVDDKPVAFVGEGVVGGLSVWGLESLRAELMHPEVGIIGGFRRIAGIPQPNPVLTYENTSPLIYQPLSHIGNFFEGYGLACASYWLTHLLFKNKSENFKLAASAITSTSLIAGHELGFLIDKPSDPLDIVGGIVGTGLYLLAHKQIGKWLKKTENFPTQDLTLHSDFS